MKDSHLKGMLERLIANSGGLALSLGSNGYGWSLYLDDTKKKGGAKAKLRTLAFGSSKSEIYYQMSCANKIIEEMRQQQKKQSEHNSPYTLLDNR